MSFNTAVRSFNPDHTSRGLAFCDGMGFSSRGHFKKEKNLIVPGAVQQFENERASRVSTISIGFVCI